jgi:hypothetical protein
MQERSKFWTLLMVLGFVLGTVAVLAPVGAAAGRAPVFGVAVELSQDGAVTTSYDMDLGGSLTVNLTITNTGDNATDANVTLTYTDDLWDLLGGWELKSWDPVALNNDTPALLSYEWELPLIMLYDANNSFIVNITTKAGDSDEKTIPLKVLTYNPVVENVVAVTSNSKDPATCVLGVHNVTTTVTVAARGNRDIADGNIEVFASHGFSDQVSLTNISVASLAVDETKDFVYETNFSGFDVEPGFYTMDAVFTAGDASDMGSSEDIDIVPAIQFLRIENVTVSPGSGLEGTNVTFSVLLNSTGTTDAVNMVLELLDYPSNVSIGNVTGINLPVGETKTVTFTWTLPEVSADTTKTVLTRSGLAMNAVNVTIIAKVPAILITDFTVPADMRIGDVKNLTATVKNNGTGDATGVVVDFYDGTTKLVSSAPFNLSVGSSTVVSLAVTLAGAADANHTFFAKAMGAERNVTKIIGHKLAPASVGITAFTVKPAKKDKQPQDSTQSFTLSISLKNSGELKSGNCTLAIREGAKTLFTESIALEPNQTVTKTYTWKVKGSGGHTATATLSGAEAGTPATMSTKCTLEYTPGFEVLLLVAAILVAAILVRKRKN